MKCSKSGKVAFVVSLAMMVLFTTVAIGQGPKTKTVGQGLNANETNLPNVPGGLIMVSHDSEVGKLTKEICETNKTKFPNCNQVMPGDTISVDANHLYTVEPWMWTANHGCVWQIAKMHLYGNPNTRAPFIMNPNRATSEQDLSTLPKEYSPVIHSYTPPDVNGIIKENDRNHFPWTELALLVVALILLALVLYYRYYLWSEKFKRNPKNFPPVIKGGLSQDPAKAAVQIANLNPTRNNTNPIVKIELGHLVCHLRDVKPFEAQMVFGDGQTRIVDIHDGDTAYRVTRQDGIVEYYRTQCGNLYGIIGMGRADFELPGAWSFIIDGTWTAPATTPNTEANTATPAPAVAPAPTAPATTATPATSPTPANDEAKPATTSEVQLPTPAPTADEKQHTITVEISDGTNTITVKATGDKANMPTRVEHTPGAKTIVYFPRGDGEK
jgi:hypothetical protein